MKRTRLHWKALSQCTGSYGNPALEGVSVLLLVSGAACPPLPRHVLHNLQVWTIPAAGRLIWWTGATTLLLLRALVFWKAFFYCTRYAYRVLLCNTQVIVCKLYNNVACQTKRSYSLYNDASSIQYKSIRSMNMIKTDVPPCIKWNLILKSEKVTGTTWIA